MWANTGLARRAGVHTRLAKAAQALNQHRRGQKGVLAVDKVVKQLVVARRAHIEELLDGALLGPGIAPPTPLEIQDSGLEVAKSGLNGRSTHCVLVHTLKPKAVGVKVQAFRESPGGSQYR